MKISKPLVVLIFVFSNLEYSLAQEGGFEQSRAASRTAFSWSNFLGIAQEGESAAETKKGEPNLENTINRPLPADQERNRQLALQSLAIEMVPRLNQINQHLKDGDSRAALTLAKGTLDDVRVKSGIDPKAKLRENFLVPIIFAANATAMSELPLNDQIEIIKTVKNFRGGLYLDVLNLTKRITLLYIKSLHAEVKRSGGVTKEDRTKIFKDLALATVVPIPIQDKNGDIITVFDEDVANEDHVYMFNREIKMYLIEAKDLGITEDSFMQYRTQLLKQLMEVKRRKVVVENSFAIARACMSNAQSIPYDSSRNAALNECFYRHFKSTGSNSNCIDLAQRILYDSAKNAASVHCFEYFN